MEDLRGSVSIKNLRGMIITFSTSSGFMTKSSGFTFFKKPTNGMTYAPYFVRR